MSPAAPDLDAALLPLMLWLSPAFPVGSFAYSQGLEWAVENGDVHDARSLGGWLVDCLTFGAPRADAILFAESFRAAEMEDLAERSRKRTTSPSRSPGPPSGGSRRRRRARPLSRRRGRPGTARPLRALTEVERVAYPVAVAAACAGQGLPLEPSLQAFVLAQIAAAVSAVVRLGLDRPDRRPEGPGDAHSRASARSPARRRARRSPTSAPAPSAPTSPRCATRRSIRGCSGREATPMRERAPR